MLPIDDDVLGRGAVDTLLLFLFPQMHQYAPIIFERAGD